MGLLKTIKSSFHKKKSTKDVDSDGSSTDAEGSKAEEVEIDNRCSEGQSLRGSERQSSQTTRIPVPTGRIGIKFAGSPPRITQVDDDSPILGKIQEGQIINSVIIPGEGEYAKLNAVPTSELLKVNSDIDGRVLIMRNSVNVPGDNEPNNDEPVVVTKDVADSVNKVMTDEGLNKAEPKDKDVIDAKVTAEEGSEGEVNADVDEEESEVNEAEKAKEEDSGDNYEQPTDKVKDNVDTEDRPVVSTDYTVSNADENEEENTTFCICCA